MACHDEPGMLSVEACRKRMLRDVSVVAEVERLGLLELVGRTNASAITALLNSPPTDNSAMDGYAIHEADLGAEGQLRQVGASMAGRPFTGSLQAGQCVRIMTGAVIPQGAAAVVMQEDVQATEVQGEYEIRLTKPSRLGENIRRCGEDTQCGDLLLPAQRKLTAADVGLLASQGIMEVAVYKRLRVALMSTGDELVPPGQPLAFGQIYDSNRAMLHAALSQAGCEVIDMGHVPDNRELLVQRFQEADRLADAVFTSGGVSVGDADLVRDVIGSLGHIHVWKVAIKPGKPFAFGRLSASVFFGLPGNPVSALVTLRQLALPTLMRMQGGQWIPPLQLRASLQAPVRKKPGRAEYQRGVLSQDATGELQVTPVSGQGSGLLTSVSKANCFIVLGQDQAGLSAGDTVMVEPFDGVL